MFTFLDIIFVLILVVLLLIVDYFIAKKKSSAYSIASAVIMSAGTFVVISYLAPVDILTSLIYIFILSVLYIIPHYLRNPQNLLGVVVTPLVQYIVLSIAVFFWLF